MARVALLGVLWMASIVGFSTAWEVVNCLSSGCTDVRAVVQGVQGVRAVIITYKRAQNMDLHGNLLTKFIEGYSPTVQWEKLNLSYNLLGSDFFGAIQSSKLKYVDISYNQLERVSVPPSVLEFIAERNKLHSIAIQSRSLQKLILPKNEFDSLSEFRNLPQLTELDLSCNELDKLNVNELFSMSQLRTLNMANNHIHIIEGTSKMRSLETLDLSNNILTTVDETFNNFPSLKILNLQGNKIVMWLDNVNIGSGIRSIYVDNNDWDCKNLGALKLKYGNKLLRSAHIMCTIAESPLGDRLVKYRKAEFRALQEGPTPWEGSISCAWFTPSPCDGDDNRVYEVAKSAARYAESVAKQNKEQLMEILVQEENALQIIQAQIDAAQQENDLLASENNALADNIKEQYEQAGLSGDDDTIVQLNMIFEHYERKNTILQKQINDRERANLVKLGEINALLLEIDDETYRKDKLFEELNKRNSTVEGYKKKIVDLEKLLNP